MGFKVLSHLHYDKKQNVVSQFLTGSTSFKHEQVLNCCPFQVSSLCPGACLRVILLGGVSVFVTLGKVGCQGLGQLTAEPVGKELVSSEGSEEAQEQEWFVDPWCPSQ